MKKTLINVLLVAAGAAIGSLVTWKFVETKYARISQEEIDSVKEEYGRLTKLMRQEIDACRKVINANQNESDDDSDEQNEDNEYYPDDDERDFTKQEQDAIDYYKLSSKYRSSNDKDKDRNAENSEKGDEGGEEEARYINGPYVISPDDFGSIKGYNMQSLDYFADGVLADSWGVELDLDETIGEDAIDHFGEYVDDVVYVRNDRTELEYEVTRDPRTYAEAVRTNPNPYYGNEN